MKKKYVMIAATFLFVALIYIGTVVIRTKSAIISGTEGKDKVADVYNEDIVDIKLEYANTHRSFLKKSIGTGKNTTYCFGVRIFKNSEPVDLSGTSFQGYFKNSNGENIELTNYGTIKDNVAYVTLPQACYKNEGLFTLSIKLVGGEAASTVRIVDGMVDNTNTGGDVTPTNAVPTYQEVLDVYDEANSVNVVKNLQIGNRYNYNVQLEWIDGFLVNWQTSGIWENVDYKYAKEVEVTPNCTYSFSGVFNSICGVSFLDDNKQFITGTNKETFTTPANCRYINIGTRKIPDDIQPTLKVVGYLKDRLDESQDTKDLYTDKYLQQKAYASYERVITSEGIENTQLGAREYFYCNPGDVFKVSGYYYNETYPLVIFFAAWGAEDAVRPSSYGVYEDYSITVPEHCTSFCVQGKNHKGIKCEKRVETVKESLVYIQDEIERVENPSFWKGKKIVWFGTSIPAGGWLGYEHPNSYPQQVGRLLGAEVINESIGSSCIHCKDPTRISESNPYGFKGGFESVSRCLTNSEEEADWIVANWNSDIFTEGQPEEMTEWLAKMIHSFGYEEKLDKYLTPSTFPDLFVFDHGFNDSSDTNNYYEKYGRYNLYTFRGGMNFLIKRILDYNPYANIIIIGNYTTLRDVTEMQDTVAKDWGIPIIKQWEYLGLSTSEKVTAKGYWINTENGWVWVEDSIERTYTMKDRLVPDQVHPFSNPTGKLEEKIAKMLYLNMKNLYAGY